MNLIQRFLFCAPYAVLAGIMIAGIVLAGLADPKTGQIPPGPGNAFAAAGLIAIGVGIVFGVIGLILRHHWPIWVRIAIAISFVPVAMVSALFSGM